MTREGRAEPVPFPRSGGVGTGTRDIRLGEGDEGAVLPHSHRHRHHGRPLGGCGKGEGGRKGSGPHTVQMGAEEGSGTSPGEERRGRRKRRERGRGGRDAFPQGQGDGEGEEEASGKGDGDDVGVVRDGVWEDRDSSEGGTGDVEDGEEGTCAESEGAWRRWDPLASPCRPPDEIEGGTCPLPLPLGASSSSLGGRGAHRGASPGRRSSLAVGKGSSSSPSSS